MVSAYCLLEVLFGDLQFRSTMKLLMEDDLIQEGEASHSCSSFLEESILARAPKVLGLTGHYWQNSHYIPYLDIPISHLVF